MADFLRHFVPFHYFEFLNVWFLANYFSYDFRRSAVRLRKLKTRMIIYKSREANKIMNKLNKYSRKPVPIPCIGYVYKTKGLDKNLMGKFPVVAYCLMTFNDRERTSMFCTLFDLKGLIFESPLWGPWATLLNLISDWACAYKKNF